MLHMFWLLKSCEMLRIFFSEFNELLKILKPLSFKHSKSLKDFHMIWIFHLDFGLDLQIFHRHVRAFSVISLFICITIKI